MNADPSFSEWIRLAEMDMATARHVFETYASKAIEQAATVVAFVKTLLAMNR